jgi:RNA polymerase sigma-32 factor
MYNLATVRNTPILSLEEEIDLFTKYKEQNCLKSAEKIIVHNLRYVANTARKLKYYNIDENDLFQEGVIGLMKAVKAFDLSKEVRFISFAAIWIRGAMIEFIENNISAVKFLTTKARTKLFFNLRTLKDKDHLTEDDAHRIAEKLNVSVEEVYDVNAYMHYTDSSLQYEINNESLPDGGGNVTLMDMVQDENIRTYTDIREESENKKALAIAINMLEGRDKDIFVRRRLSDNPPIRAELSKEYGISQQRIEQIENKAFNKVKEFVTQY